MAEHDHDHDHDHPEEDDADAPGAAKDQATALARLDRLQNSVLNASPDALRDALGRMPDSTLKDIAKAVGTPTPVLRRSANPAARLRRTSDPKHFALVSEALVQAPLEITVDTLGDNADDPTYEQLLAALEVTAEHHSAEEISAMLAYVAATGQAAAPVCDRILTEDDRYHVADPPAPDEGDDAENDPPAFGVPVPPARTASPEQRAARKARRQKEQADKRRNAESIAKGAKMAKVARRRALDPKSSGTEPTDLLD